MSKVPPIRPLNLPRVFKVKATLVETMEPFLETQLNGKNLRLLAEEISFDLPGDVQYQVVLDSIRHLAGTKLHPKTARMEAWRLAGNLRQLKGQNPVKPWRQQEKPEWMPMQVVSCDTLRTKRGKLGAVFTARILAGTACTLLTEFFWTLRFCGYFSNSMGYTGRRGKHPFHKMEEFYGLRFYGLAELPKPDEERQRFPVFRQVRVSSSLLKFNQNIIRMRDRVGFKCPEGYKCKCFQCHVGADQCPAAVHPDTFVRELCDDCKRKTWFQPGTEAMGLCVGCKIKKALGHD